MAGKKLSSDFSFCCDFFCRLRFFGPYSSLLKSSSDLNFEPLGIKLDRPSSVLIRCDLLRKSFGKSVFNSFLLNLHNYSTHWKVIITEFQNKEKVTKKKQKKPTNISDTVCENQMNHFL